MKIEKASHRISDMADPEWIMERIEYHTRTCYNSTDKIKPESAYKFIAGLLKSGHDVPMEFAHITVEFVCDRGVLAEITRHRLASFLVQSTRYCNFSKDKFGNEITVIEPFFWKKDSYEYAEWYEAMEYAEQKYMNLMQNGGRAERARSVLPNSLKTEISMCCNIREWRHVLNLRCSKKAHPQIRELLLPLLDDLNDELPIIFGDIWEKYKGDMP